MTKRGNSLSQFLLAFVVVVEFLVAVASWLFSVLGYHVNNLFSDEGLRWLLCNGFSSFPARYFTTFVLACIAVGVLPRWADKVAWRRMCLYLLLLWLLILAFVLWPDSPVRGVNGGFFPSPFARALPVMLCLSVIVVGLCSNGESAADLLVRGIRKCSILIVFYLLLTFLVSELTFLWQ